MRGRRWLSTNEVVKCPQVHKNLWPLAKLDCLPRPYHMAIEANVNELSQVQAEELLPTGEVAVYELNCTYQVDKYNNNNRPFSIEFGFGNVGCVRSRTTVSLAPHSRMCELSSSRNRESLSCRLILLLLFSKAPLRNCFHQ